MKRRAEEEQAKRRGGRLFLLRALSLNGETEYVRAKLQAGEVVPTTTPVSCHRRS